ncbi:helix-turn-helix transcriptional regulator [Ruminococcus sp. NK3A76]|uniref:helix-turn-helix domain-containing protein n=1 Tax=Ruminococcus sp. NK3A76 TaxID=877411 RepID=UPI0004906717|nr:helix-turn-helix transcriptional regulator [Ruminococcus sp. NK3A76]
MVSDRIGYLLWVLATDNTQLAAYAGCSESNFSRLKSGSREPSKDSLTIRKFAEAICMAASDGKMTDTLRTIINANETPNEQLSDAVIEWLFDTQDSTMPAAPSGITAAQFGEKLSAAMSVAGLSNSKLSRLANIDPSYISRMRSGSRMPKNSPSLVHRLCGIIAEKAKEKGSSETLFELTGHKPGEGSELTGVLFAWLYDHSRTEGSLAVEKLIDTISAIPGTGSAGTEKARIPIQAQTDKVETYIGIEGLQSAVTRLLSSAANEGGRQLMLYSDQPILWKSGSFQSTWERLIETCIENKVRMKIIYSLDRIPFTNIFEAISKSLPVYMTGLVDSYYCTLSASMRSYRTVFLDVGHACIEGNFIRGMEREARYRYITSQDELEYIKKNYDMIMLDCKPLITVKPTDSPPVSGKYGVFTSGGIQICINEDEVIVHKLSSPHMSFCFEHPNLIKAFRRYIEEKNIY